MKNQGTVAVASGVTIGVGYHVDGKQQTWGDVKGPLGVGASVTIGTKGSAYKIPSGTHSIMAWVDDANRFAEANETNNQFFQLVTIPTSGTTPVPTAPTTQTPTPTTTALPDVVITSLKYDQTTGLYSIVVKNQGTVAVASGVTIGVGYHVDGKQQTWGDVKGPLGVGASVTIGTKGSAYKIPSGTHSIMAWVDDANRFAEANETNNQFFQLVTIPTSGTTPVPTAPTTVQVPISSSIGPKTFVATSITKGNLFAHPTGSGSTCSATLPCNIWTAVTKAVAGDVVFLRGGTYPVTANLALNNTGTVVAPVVYESYPGELAIFDGSQHKRGTHVRISVTGKFIHLRNIEVKNMPMQGIDILGTDNVIDSVHAHHNGLTGISIYSSESAVTDESKGSRNIIRNCITNNNSDVGSATAPYNNGNNADGISINSGADNRIENNLVYMNSDDGIDVWRGIRTYMGYNIVHSNGFGGGDGSGIKGGGATPSRGGLIEQNLIYSNKTIALDSNGGANVTFSNNTTWNNGVSRRLVTSTIANNNISTETTVWGVRGIETNNSWQRAGSVAFISTNPTSVSFLSPTVGGGFEDIGVYANTVPTPTTQTPTPTTGAKVYLIGDSTTESGSGWGDYFKGHFGTNVNVINAALGGRSSKSFYDEGHFNLIQNNLTTGDYLLIQFGHNDTEPKYIDRFTTTGTAPTYQGTFRDYLELYISKARAAGATPILLTPVSRMTFTSAGDHFRTHGEYPKVVRKVAIDNGVILLDLEEHSHQVFDMLGQKETLRLYAGFNNNPDDLTHFPPEKAFRVTDMVRTLLRNSSSPLRYNLLN